MTSQIEQQASNLQGHLPECVESMIPDFHNERWICICDRLRACEQRVRMEDDDYAYVSAQAEADGRRRGWSEALDAAREAVAAIVDEQDAAVWYERFRDDPANPEAVTVMVQLDRAIAAIDALRDQPADQTGYNLPDAR